MDTSCQYTSCQYIPGRCSKLAEAEAALASQAAAYNVLAERLSAKLAAAALVKASDDKEKAELRAIITRGETPRIAQLEQEVMRQDDQIARLKAGLRIKQLYAGKRPTDDAPHPDGPIGKLLAAMPPARPDAAPTLECTNKKCPDIGYPNTCMREEGPCSNQKKPERKRTRRRRA